MRHIRPSLSLRTGLAALVLLATAQLGAGEATPLRLGVLAFRGEVATRLQWSDFATWIGQQTGRACELVPLSITAEAAAARDPAISLLICNPGTAARITVDSGAIPLATWKTKSGATRLAGVIIANPQAKIATIADLKGKKVMTYGDDALGAWQIQARQMAAGGLDPQKDIQRTIAKKLDDIVFGVKAGVFDAGFIRTGVLEDLIAKGKLAAADVMVVNQQPAVPDFPHVRSSDFFPEWYLMATSSLPPETGRTIASACLAMPGDSPALAKAEIGGWVAPLDLATTLDLLKALHRPPFDK
jgi:ABC-type phosphate/phosphonate transport system substrate-binding protein